LLNEYFYYFFIFLKNGELQPQAALKMLNVKYIRRKDNTN